MFFSDRDASTPLLEDGSRLISCKQVDEWEVLRGLYKAARILSKIPLG